MVRKKPVSVIFGPVLLLIPLTLPGAGNPGYGGLTMADTMMKMMESMVQSREADNLRQALPGVRGADTGVGRQQPSPSPYGQAPQPDLRRLQGIWAGNGGERLQISGARYRLQAGAGRSTDGMVSIRGALLELYSPALDRTWVYDFAELEGRLVLRDGDGRLYLFRRIESR